MGIEKKSLDKLVAELQIVERATNERNLSNGWDVVRLRTEAVDRFLVDFFSTLIAVQNPTFPLFVGATGGYGRGDLHPGSDIDWVLIHPDNIPETNEFFEAYHAAFVKLRDTVPGVTGRAELYSPHQITHIKKDRVKVYSSLRDLRFLVGYPQFAEEVKSLIRGNIDPLEYALHHLSELNRLQSKYPDGLSNVPFDIKNGIGTLRHFQTALWLRDVEDFTPTKKMYDDLPHDLRSAVGLLLKARSWLNLRHQVKAGKKLVKSVDDFGIGDLKAFEEYFGNGSIRSLVDARKAIKHFAEATVYEKFGNKGIVLAVKLRDEVAPVILEYSLNGLGLDMSRQIESPELCFYAALLEAQKRGLALYRGTYLAFQSGARSYVRPHPLFLDFFKATGSVYSTLQTLHEFGVLGILIPGFSELETSFFEESHRHRGITRDKQAINRIRNLELLVNGQNDGSDSLKEFFASEYRKMKPEDLFAVELTLLCKGIPQVVQMPVDDYLKIHLQKTYPIIADETIATVGFLIENKDLLSSRAQRTMPTADSTVRTLVDAIGKEDYLRSLLIFTLADLDFGILKDERRKAYMSVSQWGNVKHLYERAMSTLTGESPKRHLPYELDEESARIADSIPPSYANSKHRDRVITHLKMLRDAQGRNEPVIEITPISYHRNEYLLTLVAPDALGLYWRVTGAISETGADIICAEAYTLPLPYNLALDFFEISAGSPLTTRNLEARIKKVLSGKEEVALDHGGVLAKSQLKYELSQPEVGSLYALAIQSANVRGLVSSVARVLSEEAGADIVRTTVDMARNGTASDIFFFKSTKRPDEIRRVLDKYATK